MTDKDVAPPVPAEVKAVHEAAHAVVAAVFGIPSDYVTIEADAGRAGHCGWLWPKIPHPEHPARFPDLLEPAQRADMERSAIARLAGAQAVELAFPGTGYGPGTQRVPGPDWTRDEPEGEESHHDDDLADEFAYLLAGPDAADYRKWLAAVARRLCREESEPIRRVADGLLKHGRLEREDLERLVGPNPTPTAKEETQTDD